MLKGKIDFWQLVFYVSWSILAIWLVLKVAGVFDTPVWLEYGVPVATALFAFLGLYQNTLDRINMVAVGLATLTTKFGNLELRVGRLEPKVDHIEKDVETLKVDVGVLKKKL